METYRCLNMLSKTSGTVFKTSFQSISHICLLCATCYWLGLVGRVQGELMTIHQRHYSFHQRLRKVYVLNRILKKIQIK